MTLHVVVALDNGAGRTPPLGWSSWKTCADDQCTHDVCDEDEVKSVALAMEANGMLAAGYKYIILDDCWAYPRDDVTYELRWDPVRFPSGMPSLTQWLQSRGFLFGLYTSAGNQTCSSGGRPFPIPGSRNHYDLDANTFAKWGIDYVKLDWCGDIKDEIWMGRHAHTTWAAAFNKTGRSIFLEVVAGYWFLGNEISHYANSWRFCEDHKDEWGSTEEAIACRLDQTKLTRGAPGGWPDMDYLHTGGQGCVPFSQGAHCPGQTDDEYMTSFALWTITQSPLLIDTDVRNMTAIMKQTMLNQQIINFHQSTDSPPGTKLVGDVAGCAECLVWGRALNAADWLVALVNPSPFLHTVNFTWSFMGWDDGAQATVTNLWNGTRTKATGSIGQVIQSHGTSYMRLTVLQSA